MASVLYTFGVVNIFLKRIYMEQEDYLLREIEKIGILLNMIFNKLNVKKSNFELTSENQFGVLQEMLLKDTGIDIGILSSLDESGIGKYVSKFTGFNGSNLELLADLFKEMGMKSGSPASSEYFDMALKLYDLCNASDKTFSFERERKISEIKNGLYPRIEQNKK
jgi:hypothetical protein